MIKIKKLSKNYGKTKIFENLDLNIKKGSIVSIVGPSGSGKSTLLNIISLIDTDYTGTIEINKTQVNEIKQEEKRTRFRGKNISFIFQNFNLIENLTVKENIDLVIEINKIERNYSSEEILKMVGLQDKINEYPFNLSGGEKQRVAIARAFVGKNEILLADEPTGNLDIENTKNVCKIILDLNKKTKNTIILITHDLEVAKIGKEIYELKNYKLKQKNVKNI